MMDEAILVSVVLPCYNAEAYIDDAVNSMLQQTYRNLEVIVVNDASTDNSLQKLKAITDKRLQVITNKTNLGYPGSMNHGIAKAKGKYIARMDADDICTPDRIAMQVALHEQNPNCAFVSSKRCLLSPNGVAYTQKLDTLDNSYNTETWEDLYNGTRGFTDAASLILKKHIDTVGGYRTYMRTGMDVDLWFRIMEETNGNVLVLEKFLYQRRLIPTAITFSIKTNNNLVTDKAFERCHATKNIQKKGVEAQTRLKSYIRFLTTIAVHCVIVKDYKGGAAFFMKALSYKKYIFESVFLNVLKKYYHFKKSKRIKIINA